MWRCVADASRASPSSARSLSSQRATDCIVISGIVIAPNSGRMKRRVRDDPASACDWSAPPSRVRPTRRRLAASPASRRPADRDRRVAACLQRCDRPSPCRWRAWGTPSITVIDAGPEIPKKCSRRFSSASGRPRRRRVRAMASVSSSPRVSSRHTTVAFGSRVSRIRGAGFTLQYHSTTDRLCWGRRRRFFLTASSAVWDAALVAPVGLRMALPRAFERVKRTLLTRPSARGTQGTAAKRNRWRPTVSARRSPGFAIRGNKVT